MNMYMLKRSLCTFILHFFIIMLIIEMNINTFTTEYFDIYIYIYYVCIVNCMLMLLWWTSSTVTVDWPLVTFVTSASPPHALAGSTLDNSHLYSISYLYLCGISEFSMYFIWREWVWNVTLLSIYIYIYTQSASCRSFVTVCSPSFRVEFVLHKYIIIIQKWVVDYFFFFVFFYKYY